MLLGNWKWRFKSTALDAPLWVLGRDVLIRSHQRAPHSFIAPPVSLPDFRGSGKGGGRFLESHNHGFANDSEASHCLLGSLMVLGAKTQLT